MGTNYLNDVCHPVYHVQYIVRYTVRYTVRPGMICAVGKSSARLTRSFFYAWQPSLFSLEDGKGLFGKRVSAMASFLVLAKMASHRAKTSPLYHNEPPTSIEPLRGCSSSSSLHIKRMSYTEQSSQEVPVPLLFIPAKLSGI